MKTSDTLSNSSFTLYCLSSLRVLSIVLAIMFLPGIAVPLGVNDAMIGIVCALILSIIWNCFTLLYETCSPTALPFTLMLLVDIMVCPSTLIVFAVMCLVGEVGDDSTPYDTHKRKVVAFVLLLIIGISHAVCFLVWALIVFKYEPRTKSRLSSRPRPPMFQFSNRRDAYQKQRALPPTPRRQSNASMLHTVDVLPLYTPGEIGRPPPPAYKSVDETRAEHV